MYGSLTEMIRNYRRYGNARYGNAQDGNAQDGNAECGEARARQYGGDEQRELVRRAQAGDTAARDELIGSYVPAVVSAVHQRCKRRRDEFDDCAQEVMLRLMRAVERYDLTRGAGVSTYFFRVIFHAISSFNRKGASRAARTISLADTAVPGVLDGVAEEDPTTTADHRRETEVFAAELLDRANPRERRVIERCFRGETLEAIGKRIGLSKERVRQIRESGLERIRRAVEGDRRQGGPERG